MAYVHIMFMGSLYGFIPLLPMAALFHFVKRKIDSGKNIKAAIPHMIVVYVFCFVILAILSVAGIPTASGFSAFPIINMVPFTGIYTYSIHYAQNIMLFIPFGFLLPMLWKKFDRLHITVIYGALFSLSIEILQIFCPRVTDIDDFLMNTAGAAAGYCLFVLAKKLIPGISVISAGDAKQWKWEPYFYVALAWASMVFVKPVASWLLMGSLVSSPGAPRMLPPL